MTDTAAQQAIANLSNAPYQTFVDFTSNLIQDVFETLVKTTKDQMVAYSDLVKAVSGELSDFQQKALGSGTGKAVDYIKNVLIASYGDDDTKKLTIEQITGQQPITFVPDSATALDQLFAGIKVNDAEWRPEYDTSIASDLLIKFVDAMLHKSTEATFNQLQTLLRMGMMRVIPTKGFIETSALFSFASSDVEEHTSSVRDSDFTANSTSWGVDVKLLGGFGKIGVATRSILGGFFGGSITGGYHSAKSGSHSTIKVINDSSKSSLQGSMEIAGRVHVDFISDYFPAMPATAAVSATTAARMLTQ